MAQLPLSLNLPPVYSADNFFVSASNQEAYRWITIWPHWPDHAVLICGPKGCGKTHLGQLWAKQARAQSWPASGLDAMDPAAMRAHWLIEDIERTRDERLLLHLFNMTREQGFRLLLTSAVAPYHLPFTLPDLTSRLLAMPYATIVQPDDTVLAGAMRKQFADRQMKVADDVIAYALPRMERSLGKVRELVELVDKSALAERKNVTVPFIKRLLETGMQQSFDLKT